MKKCLFKVYALRILDTPYTYAVLMRLFQIFMIIMDDTDDGLGILYIYM